MKASVEKIEKIAGLKVLCVSELGWFNTAQMLDDEKRGGGSSASQWDIPWSIQNAAGYCAYLEMEKLDSSRTCLLLDAGWNPEYMRRRFAETGIASKIKSGEIEALIFSHEDNDHFWGLESVLELNPEIKIVIPDTFSERAISFISGKDFPLCGARNRIRHSGILEKIPVGASYCLMPELSLAIFDVAIPGLTRGETSLVFSLKDKGLVLVTGCCHQGLPALLNFVVAQNPDERLYGIYGGLHLSPFGPLNEKEEKIIESIGSYKLEKIACNHCSGEAAVRKMLKIGLPVSGGSGKDQLYVGNGDLVEF